MHTKNQVILFVFHRPDNTLNACYPFVYSFRSIVKRYFAFANDFLNGTIWTVFTLAWYQWYDNCSFRELFAEVPCSSIAGMYPKYHEMDLMHSADEIRRLRRLSAYRNRIGLKNKREQAGLSQRDLAEISGVPVRTIQQYEQQRKDIRKAAYETVCRLADALHCAPDDCMPPNV